MQCSVCILYFRTNVTEKKRMKGGRKEERKEGQGQTREEVRRRQDFPGTEEVEGKFQNFLQLNR